MENVTESTQSRIERAYNAAFGAGYGPERSALVMRAARLVLEQGRHAEDACATFHLTEGESWCLMEVLES
jgi:hypothetical protein